MKASINQRLKTLTADPAEALDVARNIEELVRRLVSNQGCILADQPT